MKTVLAPLFLLASLMGASTTTSASDDSVKTRLEARGIKYELDGDGDFKVTYNYSKDGRTQLVYVSGKTGAVAGFKVREIFSPSARIQKDGINGAKALELLIESRNNKLGSWEIMGDVLYFVIKVPDNLSAAQLISMMDIASETADDMELEISGRDDL